MAFTFDHAGKLIKELLEIAESVVDAALAKETPLATLGAMFVARAAQSTYSAALLARHGLNGDAMSVGRTITELAIDYRYIALKPDERIKKFEEYDAIAIYKIARAADKLHGGKLDPDMMQIIKDRRDEAKKNNPESTTNWAGVRISDRAKSVDESNPNLRRVPLYELAYADACNASHSGFLTLQYVLVGWGQDAAIHMGPMEPAFKPIDLAFISMTTLTADVREINGLADELDKRLLALGAARVAAGDAAY